MDDRTRKIFGWVQLGLGVAPLVLQLIQAFQGQLMDHGLTMVSAANVVGGANHIANATPPVK